MQTMKIHSISKHRNWDKIIEKINIIVHLFHSLMQTVNIHSKRDERHGVVNNQILDWSFKMDGLLHNASQDVVYDTLARDVVSAAVDGYNGEYKCP